MSAAARSSPRDTGLISTYKKHQQLCGSGAVYFSLFMFSSSPTCDGEITPPETGFHTAVRGDIRRRRLLNV